MSDKDDCYLMEQAKSDPVEKVTVDVKAEFSWNIF